MEGKVKGKNMCSLQNIVKFVFFLSVSLTIIFIASCNTQKNTADELTAEEIKIFEEFRSMKGNPERSDISDSVEKIINSLPTRMKKGNKTLDEVFFVKLLGTPDRRETRMSNKVDLYYTVCKRGGETHYFIIVLEDGVFYGVDPGGSVE